MRDWAKAAACVVAVVALGLGARWLANSAWQSVVHYRSPYQFHAALPAGPRLADRVILVTIDGLRLDTSRSLAFLSELRSKGAEATARVGLPSLSNPGRAVMATGAWADVHGITSNFAKQRVEVDSIFSIARAAGLRTAVAGSRFWQQGFAPHLSGFLGAAEESERPSVAQLREWQKQECAPLAEFARAADSDLLAIDLVAGDEASHNFGALSPAAREIFSSEDSCLRGLLASRDLGRTVVIVTADHGHIDAGGHGGDEPAVMTVPLVMAGGPARRGVTTEAEQTDIAPTICAVLGLPLPATSQGRILLEMLQLDDRTAAALRARQEQQSTLFSAFRRTVLEGTVWEARTRERSARTLPAVAIGAVLLLLLAWTFVGVLRGKERLAAACGVVCFGLAYSLLFRLAGLAYSLSAVNKEAYLEQFFFKDMLAGGAALVVAVFAGGVLAADGPAKVVPYSRAVSWNPCDRTFRLAAATTLAVSLLLSIVVLSAYWFDGLWMGAWLPNFKLRFMVYLDLLILFAFCFAVWLTPLAAWASARLSSRFQVPSSQPAKPGTWN